MKQVDKILFDIYGSYPCISPGRYQSYFILTKYFNKNSFNKAKILELGCGTGVYSLYLDKILNNSFYTGIDLSFKNNPYLISNVVDNIKVDFKKIDATKLSFKKASFDLVLSFWSLEHIENDINALKQAYIVLKKEGTFIIAVPSIYTFLFHLGRHGYRSYTKKNITDKLSKTGFKIKKVYSVGGLFGFVFSLLQNWLDNLVLAPFYIYYKIFNPEKLKGDSKRDIGGGLAKKIVSRTTHAYRKTLIGRKIHFYFLKLSRFLDGFIPVLPYSYLIIAEK